MNIPPFFKKTVGFLHQQDPKDDQYKPLGTAFFIHVTRGNCKFHYIVTCKHVVKECVEERTPVFLRLNRPDIKDVSYLQLRKEWVFHDENEVDLAVMNWLPTPPDPSAEWQSMDFEKALLSDEILASAEHTIKEGDEVVFLGLFAQYTGVKRNFPAYRFGHIALITDEKIEGEYGPADYLVVEGLAHRGFSGSPLFIRIERPSDKQEIYYLYGVVSNFYSAQKMLIFGPEISEIYTHSGISLAVPTQKIVDILNGDKLTKARNEFIEEMNKGK